jgi:hypothetical protein
MPLSHHWHTMMMVPYWQLAQIVGVWYSMMFGGNPSHWQFFVHTIAQRWGTLHLSFPSLVSANCCCLQIILFSGGLYSNMPYWFNTSNYIKVFQLPLFNTSSISASMIDRVMYFQFNITLLNNLNLTIWHHILIINASFLWKLKPAQGNGIAFCWGMENYCWLNQILPPSHESCLIFI